jgi:SnoaL-like domain
MVSRAHVAEWLDGYERAWRTPGTDTLGELFTDGATYSQGPYKETKSGLAEIAEMWEAERDGPDEVFTMRSEILAVEGQTAVARIAVAYGDPVRQEYRDIWVMQFADDGRCSSFEEWPFWPEQSHVADG